MKTILIGQHVDVHILSDSLIKKNQLEVTNFAKLHFERRVIKLFIIALTISFLHSL
jgi:hypothetical protein